jgi:hypothetical protein
MKLNELLSSINRDVPITLTVDEQYFRVCKKGDLVSDFNYYNNRIHYGNAIVVNVGIVHDEGAKKAYVLIQAETVVTGLKR